MSPPNRTARRVAPAHEEKPRDILPVLDPSPGPEGVNRPGFRLHELNEPLKGRLTVSVSGIWHLAGNDPPVRGRRTGRWRLRGLKLRRLVTGMCEPPHPGGIVKRQCLGPLGFSVTRAAKGLRVTRLAQSKTVNEHTGTSVEMAIRLSKAFDSTPRTWLGMQIGHDPCLVRKRTGQIAVEHFAAA